MATNEARALIVKDSLITNANVLALVNGSETALHSHAGGGGFTSRCDVYRATSNQAINDSTYTRIQFNTARYDNLGEFDIVTNYRFVAQAAGYYLISAAYRLVNLADTKQCEIAVLRNNDGGATIGNYDYGAVCRFHGSAATAKVVAITKLFYLAATNYVEAFAWHNVGSQQNIAFNAKGDTTWMTIIRIA